MREIWVMWSNKPEVCVIQPNQDKEVLSLSMSFWTGEESIRI